MVAFWSHLLTRFGGAYLLHRFFIRIRLKKLLMQKVRLPQRNDRSSISDVVAK